MLSRRRLPIALLLALAWLLLTSGAVAEEAACVLAADASTRGAGGADAFASALSQGPFVAALAAFSGGFLVSLTPCVYPMVAITVSVFGARQTTSRLQGVALSASFVAGIVVVFVAMGVVAGLTGGIFGQALQSTWVIVGLAALFLVMAAAMFGAFELALPSFITNRLATVGGAGYGGAFLLGLALAPIAAPCTGPVLVSILAFIGKTQSIPLGVASMTAFALGLGVPFFLVGAFAVQLPKSGAWMVSVKSILGIVLIVLALYYLSGPFPVLGALAMPGLLFAGGVATAALAVGWLSGAVTRSFDEPGVRVKLLKGLGVAASAFGLFLALVGFTLPTGSLHWRYDDLAKARAEARAAQKPLLVDFGASWCASCKELDKYTFADETVKREASRFVAVKVDATDDSDPRVNAAMKSNRVAGLPTVLVFDSAGKEALRCKAFVPPEEFVGYIKSVN